MNHQFLYDVLTGEDAPKHIWNEDGRCIRCGEDAEEWEAGCVEEIVNEYQSKLDALQAIIDYNTKLSGWKVEPE